MSSGLRWRRHGFGPIGKACGILRVRKFEYWDHVKRRKPNVQIDSEALEGFAVERFDLRKGRYGCCRINRGLGREGRRRREAGSRRHVQAGPAAEGDCETGKEARWNAFKHTELYCSRWRMCISIGCKAPCFVERDVASRS